MKVNNNNNLLLKIILFRTYVSWSLTSVLITSGIKLNFSDFSFKKFPFSKKIRKPMIFQMKILKMETVGSKFVIWFFRWKFPKWNLQVPFSEKLSEESNKKVGTFRFHFWNLHLKNHCFYYLFGKKELLGTSGKVW